MVFPSFNQTLGSRCWIYRAFLSPQAFIAFFRQEFQDKTCLPVVLRPAVGINSAFSVDPAESEPVLHAVVLSFSVSHCDRRTAASISVKS
jgi:hypothetical protein